MQLSEFFFSKLAFMVNVLARQFYQQDAQSMIAEPNFSANLNLPVPEIYDFIIVGGGTAGCLIANRLASANFHVLLLEAGGDPPGPMTLPISNEVNRETNEIFYDYYSTPQQSLYAPPRVIRMIQGKGLGGTSVVNAMFFNRGHPYDFDNWANTTGDPSWSYQNLLPHFMAFENYIGEHHNGTDHGYTGELPVETEEYRPGWDAISRAAAELGFVVGADPNGPQQVSFTKQDANKRNGRKVHSYDAFIANVPTEQLQTLVIKRYSTAEEILVHQNKTAYGVRYYRHDFPQIAYATKEVILSAGAFGSAMLLLKSGIGPADELAELGIDSVVDLPVGKNLQDHPSLAVPFYMEDNRYIFNQENLTMEDINAFLANGTSLLSVRHTRSGQAFISTSVAVADGQSDWPDALLAFYFGRGTTPPELVDMKSHLVDFTIYLMRPKSRAGSIKLNSTDINFPPIIDLQHFYNESNREIFVDAIRTLVLLTENTTALGQELGAQFPDHPLLYPDCRERFEYRSEQYWNCFVDYSVRSGQHLTGTCRMGLENGTDGNSVVDSRLRVHGVAGLRVIDASVMPEVVNGNTLAATLVIAQKGATDIVNEYLPDDDNVSTTTEDSNDDVTTDDRFRGTGNTLAMSSSSNILWSLVFMLSPIVRYVLTS